MTPAELADTRIDAKSIAQSALVAFAMGSLCAQNPAPDHDLAPAFYIDARAPGVRCAIGWGLTETQATLAAHYQGLTRVYQIDLLIAHKVFRGPSPTEAYHLRLMQKLHDLWGTKARNQRDQIIEPAPPVAIKFRDAFVNLATAIANGQPVDTSYYRDLTG